MERQAFIDAVAQHQDMVYRVALHWFGDPPGRGGRRTGGISAAVYRGKALRRAGALAPLAAPSDGERRGGRGAEAWAGAAGGYGGRCGAGGCVPMESIPEPVFEEPGQRDLYREVLALPEKYRTVLGLYYYEELSTKEIAALLNIRQTAVTTRLARGRELLKQRLTEVWNDE